MGKAFRLATGGVRRFRSSLEVVSTTRATTVGVRPIQCLVGDWCRVLLLFCNDDGLDLLALRFDQDGTAASVSEIVSSFLLQPVGEIRSGQSLGRDRADGVGI